LNDATRWVSAPRLLYSSSDKSLARLTTIRKLNGKFVSLHVHAHMIAFDGVYAARSGESPQFYALRAPDDAEVRWVAEAVARRTAALQERLGGDPHGEQAEDRLACETPWLSQLYSASIGGRIATGPHAGRRIQTAGMASDIGIGSPHRSSTS
jgi:hypothetical protein